MSENNGKRCFQLRDKASANNRGSLTISPFSCEWHPCLKENISVIQIKMNHLTVYGMYYFSIELNIKKKKSKNIYIPRCSGFTLEIYAVVHCLLQ